MTSYTWILLILASLAATRAQDLDLSDDDDDKPPAKPTVKPAPPKNSNPDLDLSEALNLDEELKTTSRERGTGGESFDDKDLLDVNEGGGYVPNKGQTGGGGADPGYDDQSGGASEQPQDLNQKWLQLIKMLDVKIPEGLSVWIAQFLQAVEPLLEQFQGLLNVTEEKAEL